MAVQRSLRHLAVIPSLRRDPETLLTLTGGLEQAGIMPRLVITGKQLDEELQRRGVPHLSPHANPGFSASIQYGIDHAGTDWDWLYVINDDVVLTDAVGEVVAELDAQDPSLPQLVFLDPEPRRRIPDASSIVGSVSLWSAALSRLRSSQAAPGPSEPWYKSFSCVAISRGLWEATGGLDRSLPYTYEDALLSARAHAMGAIVRETELHVAEHEGSSTSNKFISAVLPVGLLSARRYLEIRGHRPAAARVLLVVALLLRLPMVPLNRSANAKDHLRAIGRSIAAVLGFSHPTLPPYQES